MVITSVLDDVYGFLMQLGYDFDRNYFTQLLPKFPRSQNA